MLRECRRVLEPGGRLAAATIELVPGLSDRARARALEVGPAMVGDGADMSEVATRAGFVVHVERDVTRAFRSAVVDRLDALESMDTELRLAEGDHAVAEERGKRERLISGIDEGLLRRTLIVAAVRHGLKQTSAGVT